MNMPSGFNHLKDELQSFAIVGWPGQALDQLRQMSETIDFVVNARIEEDWEWNRIHHVQQTYSREYLMEKLRSSLEEFQKWSY